MSKKVVSPETAGPHLEIVMQRYTCAVYAELAIHRRVSQLRESLLCDIKPDTKAVFAIELEQLCEFLERFAPFHFRE